jgi:hypothetical protein
MKRKKQPVKRPTTKKKTASVVARTRRGRVRARVPANATPEARAEAVLYVQTLDVSGQIAHGKTLTPGTTHAVERDSKGKKTLVRKRYSAT